MLKPVTRVKVKLREKVSSRYVNVRATCTSTPGTARFTKLAKRAHYRVYEYTSGGRNAVYSGGCPGPLTHPSPTSRSTGSLV